MEARTIRPRPTTPIFRRRSIVMMDFWGGVDVFMVEMQWMVREDGFQIFEGILELFIILRQIKNILRSTVSSTP